jgi:hypothetical protein
MDEFHLFICPHCDGCIIVHHGELNCRIFRHGVYRDSNQPIPPHTSKEECERLVAEQRIVGCGKPFRVTDTMEAVVCDYI